MPFLFLSLIFQILPKIFSYIEFLIPNYKPHQFIRIKKLIKCEEIKIGLE